MSSPRNTIPDPEKRPISPPTAGLAAAAKCPPVGTTCFIPETLEIFEARVDLNSNVVFARDQDTHQLLAFSDAIAIAWDQQLYLEMIHNEIQATGSGVREIFDAADRDGGWFDDLATRIEGRLSNESTFMADFLRNIFLPLLIDGLSGTDPSTEKVAAVLGDFIHPDLSKLGDNTAIGLGRIKDAIAEATATEDFRSFDTATLLLQRLDELVDATKGSGGTDISAWAKSLEPHSDPEPQVKVTAVDHISPWIKMPTGVVSFIVDRFGVMLRDIVRLAFGAADLIAPAFKPMIVPALDLVDSRVGKLANVTPDRAFPLAKEFITDAFSQGLKAQLLAAACEKAGDQVKNLGIQQIAGLVGQLSGFDQLAEALWGTALKAGIGRPAEYQVNSITRSRLLGEGQLIEAAVERKISLGEMREIMRFHGYTEHHIDITQAYMWTDPRLREIVLLASDVSVNDDDIRHWLSEAGYEDQDIERMAPVVMQQSLKAQRQALTSEVLINLREGFLTEEEAEGQFDRLRYTEEAKRLLFDTGRLGFRREIMQGQITELEQMFQLGQIMEPEFRLALNGLGVRKEKIEAIVGKAVSKFTGRVSKEEESAVDKDVRELQQATLAALRAQFQARLIPGEAFFANLVAVGFLPQIAREIVALEQIKVFTKAAGERDDEADRLREEIRRARIAAFVELFQDGFIDDRQLLANLLALGLAPELANALVFREIAKKAELPKPDKTTTAH